MRINEKTVKLLNEQVNKEFYSAYLYLSFSIWFAEKGLMGFAHWYDLQAKEELEHANKFIKYLGENELEIKLEAIAKPESKFDSMELIIRSALEHEKFITDSISVIYDDALENKDYRTMEFLNFFIKEQMEEEVNATDVLNKYLAYGKDSQSLYLLDKDLGKRA